MESIRRRNFVKKIALSYLSSIAAPSALSACADSSEDIIETDFEGKVLVIGAGAAGLYAGHTLKTQGVDFEILEASDRIGGRMGKVEGFADYPLDLGAQWLHGKRSVAGDLIDDTGTKITRDRSDYVFWFENKLTDDLPKNVLRLMGGDADAADISFEAYAQEEGFGPEYRYIVQAICGSQGADASELSAKWNAVEEENWSSGNADYKFEETFFDLVNDHLAADIRDHIRLNVAVTSIDYQGDTVSMTTTDGDQYTADKLIITVPITILQDGDITFTPALPKEKREAFDRIGMGPGMKVFLKFNVKFFDENIAGGSVCATYADEIVGKNGNDAILLAFIMGNQAQDLSDLGSDDAIAQALLDELDEMYDGQASQSFVEAFVQDWTREPFIRGAYSFSRLGINNSRSIAAQSIDNKLFFAGEAMNLNGHHQTVHGAMETGYEQVMAILQR